MSNDNTPFTFWSLSEPLIGKTNPETEALEERMREAAKRGLTPFERRAQTIGWVLQGLPDSGLTYEGLEAEFDLKYGPVSA